MGLGQGGRLFTMQCPQFIKRKMYSTGINIFFSFIAVTLCVMVIIQSFRFCTYIILCIIKKHAALKEKKMFCEKMFCKKKKSFTRFFF